MSTVFQNNVPVLFTLGRIFFPTMLHRERELRARMRWVAIIFGVILVAGVFGVIAYVQKSRPNNGPETVKTLRSQSNQ